MRTVTLRGSHVWGSAIYGPGANVEVPDDFPTVLKGADAPDARASTGEGNTGDTTVTHPDDGVMGDPATFRRHTPPFPQAATVAAPSKKGGPVNDSGTGADSPGLAAAGAAGGKEAAKGKTGNSREALEDMTVSELKELADDRGITVERGDGEDGAPLKSDYIDALAGGK